MNKEVEQALSRAVDWVVGQQGDDGGWHSTTYGQLKEGAAVTALALYAIAHLPPGSQANERARSNGCAFLERGITKRGTIAGPDGTLDFPTYAAALWLITQARRSPSVRSTRSREIIDYLLAAQVAKPRGFEPDSPSFGGWDFLGAEDARGITTGTNISVTAYAAEALGHQREHAPETIDSALRLARAYVLRCQQLDGGFTFTCEPASLNNKAAYRDEKLTQPRSYGTATCDGVRALLACGVATADEPVAKGLAWIAKRPALEVVPGFEGLPPELGWQRGLRFYYYAALAPLLKHLPDREARQTALQKHLLELQKTDGSWVNESDRMRENDPLIATSLAIVALASAA